MHGKMPYQRKWSKEQEKAVVDAQLHYGMTSKQATKAANEGQLPGIGTGLDAFAIPLATVREYTTRARQEQAAKQRTAASPAKVLEDAVGEMGQMLAMAVDKAKRRQRRGDNVALELGQIARSAQELVKLAKAIRDVDGKRVDLRPETEKPTGEDFIGQLAQREHGPQREARHRAPNGEHQRSETPQRSEEEPETRAESGDGRRAGLAIDGRVDLVAVARGAQGLS